MPNPINLSSVNISLQQFDAIASGRYNAGEVKLADENSLAKMNNHVTLTFKNNVSISHAEVIAIKEAFVKALANNGVSEEGISMVRRQLGLGAEGGVVNRQLNMKPLTRQQIREIIDSYADAINNRPAVLNHQEVPVGTSATIYADVSQRTKEDRAASRNRVNDSLAANRQIDENASLARFGSVVGGNASFNSTVERHTLLDMAQELRGRVMKDSFGAPSPDRKVVLKHSFGSGQSMTFDTGLSEVDFVKRLDDEIARLTFGEVGETATSARAHNKYLAEALRYKGADAMKLPYEFKALADEVVSSLRQDFGRGVVKGNARLGDLLTLRDVEALLDIYGDNPVRATPDSIRAGLFAKAKQNVIFKMLDKRLASILADEGLDISTNGFRNNLRGSLPEMFEQLNACENKAAAEAVIDQFADQIKTKAHQRAVAERCRANVKNMCLEKFALESGIALKADGALSLEYLEKKAKALSDQISSGDKAFASDAEIEAAFRKIAEDFATNRAAALKKVDESGLPPATCNALKRTLLAVERTDDIDLDSFISAAADIPLSGLKKVFAQETPKKEDVFSAIDNFCKYVNDSMRLLYSANNGVLGAEETQTAMKLFFDAAVGGDDAFASKIAAFFSRQDVEGEELNANCVHFQGAATAYKALRTSSSRPEPEPKEQQSLTIHAVERGYALGEVKMLESVADIYRKATGCTLEEAEEAALNPASDARRLYSYGGRFTASPGNFKKGLRLMQSFGPWFDQLVATYSTGSSITAINAVDSAIRTQNKPGYEKFLFEEIAVNDEIELDVDDPESVFCMENNPAMRFVGRGYTNACANTLLNVPAEKRGIVYEVFDTISPLSEVHGSKGPYGRVYHHAMLLSRVLRHFDEIVALKDRGEFTRENLVKLLYADHKNVPANASNGQIGDYLTNAAWTAIPNNLNAVPTIIQMLADTGLTFDEVVAAVKEDKTLPNAPYVSSFMIDLQNMNNATEDAKTQAVLDFSRPAAPVGIAAENNHFTFKLGGQTFTSAASNVPNYNEHNGEIADKVIAFCGAVHSAQAKVVLYCLSQSGSTPVKGMSFGGGVLATEHMPLTYTITRDADTGMVKIHYSEPTGCPKKFHWDVSVDVNGVTTSTKIVVEE